MFCMGDSNDCFYSPPPSYIWHNIEYSNDCIPAVEQHNDVFD